MFFGGRIRMFFLYQAPPFRPPSPPLYIPLCVSFSPYCPRLAHLLRLDRSQQRHFDRSENGDLIPDFPACRPPLEPLSRRPAPAGKRASPSPKAVSHLRGRGQGNATGRAAQDPVKCWQILVGTDPSVGSAPPHARVAGGIMRWQPGQSVPFRKRPGRHR